MFCNLLFQKRNDFTYKLYFNWFSSGRLFSYDVIYSIFNSSLHQISCSGREILIWMGCFYTLSCSLYCGLSHDINMVDSDFGNLEIFGRQVNIIYQIYGKITILKCSSKNNNKNITQQHHNQVNAFRLKALASFSSNIFMIRRKFLSFHLIKNIFKI